MPLLERLYLERAVTPDCLRVIYLNSQATLVEGLPTGS